LAKQLGAVVFTYKGEDVADTIFRFAKEYRVGHIVIGSPSPKPFWKRFGSNKNIVKNLIKNAKGVTIIVLDTSKEEPIPTKPLVEVPEGMPRATIAPETATPPRAQLTLGRSLSARRIIIWDVPVQKEVVLQTLVAAVGKDNGIEDLEGLFSDIIKRPDRCRLFGHVFQLQFCRPY
jgi:two-component system sensor histidine kinase KdpD